MRRRGALVVCAKTAQQGVCAAAAGLAELGRPIAATASSSGAQGADAPEGGDICGPL